MRALALIFGLIGAVGSGYLGMKWMGTDKGLGERLAVLKSLNQIIQDDDGGKSPKAANTAYALLGGAALGLLGVGAMLADKGKLAALLFLVGFGASVAIFKDPKITLFTFGLALAAVFAFITPPKLAHSRVRQAEARGD